MTISLRLNDNDGSMIKKFAESKGVSVSELIRETVANRIEDENKGTYRKAAVSDVRPVFHIGNIGNPDTEVELL